MRIVILSRRPELYSTRVLVEAGQARGHEVRVLDTLQFDIRVSRRNPELFYQGELVGAVDAVIPRIGASITFFGLAVVRQFEMMGVYCVNESQAIARSRDKLRCLQVLSRHDIGLPPTVYTRQADHISGCMERVDGPPVVVKLLQGTQGIGRVLALRVAGVDMIESGDGPMVMEVNSSPGLEGIQKTTGVDVAEDVIELIERELAPSGQGPRPARARKKKPPLE